LICPGISDIDTAGVWLLCRLKKQVEDAGGALRFEGSNPHIDEMLASFSEEPEKPEPSRAGFAVVAGRGSSRRSAR
jgi:phospholipid/cholesterol/gamma-HCH transport system permease protein